MMSGVNYVMHGCSSATLAPEVSPVLELNTEGKHCCSYYSRQGDRW